jgi:hypothetical protein
MILKAWRSPSDGGDPRDVQTLTYQALVILNSHLSSTPPMFCPRYISPGAAEKD